MTLLGSEHSILIRSKFRTVLQLRLQQRRTQEQLADQGIMPHPVSDASCLEAQMRLKRARLASDLSERLAVRPGPLELVQKNIIPLASAVGIMDVSTTVNHGKFPKQEDSYAFEEDSSSDGLSPEQHHSDESQGSACPSSEAVGSAPSSSSSPALTSPRQGGPSRDPPDQSQDEGMSGANGCQATPPIPVPAIVKSKTSSSDNNNNKNRHKKPKDVKPKVKKLKYHQYIPPDQKASEKSPPPMDSAYARLLQQQQLFLQLQILSQQKHAHAQQQQASQHTHTHTQQHSSSSQQQQHQHVHAQHAHAQAQQRQASFSYQPLHPPPPAQSHKAAGDHLSGCGGSNGPAPGGALHHSGSSGSPSNKTTYPNNPTGLSPVKPGPLPANLDDLKVSELRQQLRVRGMPVSGTKTALIERLRPFRDSNNNNNGGGANGGSSSPSSGSSDNNMATMTFPVTPTGSLHSSSYQQSPSPSSAGALSSHHGVCYYPYPGMSSSSTPPVSPSASSSDDLSLSAEGGSLPGDGFSDVPMSSSASSPPPPRFHALQQQQQPSSLSPPLRLSSEEGPPRGGRGGGGGEGLVPDGLVEAEKDKMLVEKQKVIEELTWKLHQEQRQVEELKMQLHKRKRCYGATQDGGHPPPPQPHPHPHHHHHPSSMAAMMGQQQQHFFGVTVKQEPVAPGSASSCPLLASSPKQLKSPPPPPPGGLLMDDMGGAMSAFLSPQCSPQDSPPSGNPPSSSSGSPQPPPSSSSPPNNNNNNPYLLLSPLGCGHPLPQGGNNARGRNMQIQQKNGVQPVHCAYPSDQRGLLQGVYPNSSELGLNPRAAAKANPSNMQKMSILPSHRQGGQKCQVSAFSSSESAASDLRQPPCYEDAVKQQLTRSQQMDELLDVLIESGGSVPGLVVPKLHRHYVHLSPSSSQLPYLDHLSASHMADSHLETLLGGPMGRGAGGGGGEAALLKMAAEDGGGLDDERNGGGGGGEGYTSPHGHHHHHHQHHQHHHPQQHPHQDKLLAHNNRDLMDTPNNPLSPIITINNNNSKVSPVGVDQQGMTIGMAFGDSSSWETMEWLDLTPPSSATAFHSVAPPNGPSIFNTEFLDDINLNSAMDLHLEHW